MESAKLLSLKAAARAIGVQPENLQAEADAGRVPHTRIGADYLFSLVALESALSARASGKRDNGNGARHAR
jgi:hypothetical protein